MGFNDVLMEVIEIIGVSAFAISGIMVGIHNKLDIVGITVLALVNALGGGVLRDIILGVIPPMMFREESLVYVIIAVSLSLIIFTLAKTEKTSAFIAKYENSIILHLADTFGLAAFCVSGINVALNLNYGTFLLLLFVGCITGVGGGIMRDIMIGQLPLVFKKRVYVLPAVLGSALYIVLIDLTPMFFATIISMSFIVGFRFLAIIYKWNLPCIK